MWLPGLLALVMLALGGGGAVAAPPDDAPTPAQPPGATQSQEAPGQSRQVGPSGTVFTSESTATPSPAVLIEDINPDNSDLHPSDPDGASGGRVNGLASVQGNNDVFYGASEWGGLYKSLDGGDTWFHLSGHRPMATWDVAVDPGNTGTVYATSFYDGRIEPQSGINVSRDGGSTWTRPTTATPPDTFNCSNARRSEPSAFGIALRPDMPSNVFVGTNCGIARSTDSGTTWEFIDPTPATAANNVWDVVAQSGGTIDACGQDGHVRSTDNGTTWTQSTLPVTAGAGPCSLAVSPDESYVLFMTVGTQILETDDAGGNWTFITNPNPQGRIPMVAINDRSGTDGRRFDLWFGDVSLHRFDCTTPENATSDSGNPRCPTTFSGGPFTRSAGAHDDAGDLAFDSEAAVDACPLQFSSDGGIYRNTTTTSPGCHSPSWNQPSVTPHATWLFAMDGADRAGTTQEDLYFGLQDNGSWGTTNAGAADPSWHNQDCCDVFDIVSDQNRVVYTVCCFGAPATRLFIRNPGLTGGGQISAASRPPGNLVGFSFFPSLDQFGPDDYVVATLGTGGGVYVTDDIAAGTISWTQLGSAPAGTCGVKASTTETAPEAPTFYALVNNCGAGPSQVVKYTGTSTSGTWQDVTPPSGGVGVFDVDPTDPNRLYASSLTASGPQMMRSDDGGSTWETDTALDSLMTGNGTFNFQTARGPTNFTNFGGYAQPTLVAFDPEDPNLLVAGGADSGVFLSTNGGDTWGLLTDPFNSHTSDIPHLPRPRYAYFDHTNSATSIYVGTQGRGVWRLTPPSADVSISKVAAPSPAIAGEQLFYTLTVNNSGPDEAVGVTVVDELPDQVTFVTDNLGACTEDPTDTLTCDLGNMTKNDTVELEIKVLVDADAVAVEGSPFGMTNTATVSTGGSIDPDPDNNTAMVSTIVEESADLQVTKVCKPDGELRAGETGTCEIFVDNLGPSWARNVVLTDQLVSDSGGEFTIESATATQGGCTVADDTVTCELGDLEPATPSTSGRAVVTVDVTADEPMDINDVATVTSDTPDPDTSNNEASGSLHVSAVADLSLTKSASPEPVVAGTTLTYDLTIQNHGPSTAENVVVEDILPSEVSVDAVSATDGSCTTGTPGDASDPTRCAFDSMATGDVETMTVEVTVAPEVLGTIANDARVSSDAFDDDNSNDLANVTSTVVAEADMGIAKVDVPDPVLAGTPIDYTVTVVNHGPSAAQGVVVTDPLPDEVSFESVDIVNGPGECALVNRTLECQLGTLAPNAAEPVVINIEVLVDTATPAGTEINNTVSVSSSTADPSAGNDSATAITTVAAGADVVTTKTSSKDVYSPSETIVWTVTVANAGPSDALDVVMVDTLPLTPKKVIFDFDTGEGACAYDETSHTVACDFGTIPDGAARSVDIHVTTKGNLGEITNEATASSSTPDPDGTNNDASKTVLVTGGGGPSK